MKYISFNIFYFTNFLVCEECIGDKDLCEELCGNFDYIPIIVAVIIIALILLIISFLIWKYHTNLCPGSGTYRLEFFLHYYNVFSVTL